MHDHPDQIDDLGLADEPSRATFGAASGRSRTPTSRRARASGSGSANAGVRRSALPSRARASVPVESAALPKRLARRDESQLLEVIAEVREELLVLALQSVAANRELAAMRSEILGGIRASEHWVDPASSDAASADEPIHQRDFVAWSESVFELEAGIAAALAEPASSGARCADLDWEDWPRSVQQEVSRCRDALLVLVRDTPLREAAQSRVIGAARPQFSLSRPRGGRPARDLSRRWHIADRRLRSAEARFVQANQGLVALVVKRYLGVGLSYPDLMQEGNIGLLRAVEKFDCRRGCRFSTYATWWIRQAVRRALANQARMIRLPVHTADARYALRQASNRLEARLGRQASNLELAEHTGMAQSTVGKLMTLVGEPVSLEAPRGDSGETCLYDSLSDDVSQSPAEGAGDREIKAQLQGLLEGLSPREGRMVWLRFGLDGRHERTLDEVGLEFGLTRERVRQVLEKALAKLRAAAPDDWGATGS